MDDFLRAAEKLLITFEEQNGEVKAQNTSVGDFNLKNDLLDLINSSLTVDVLSCPSIEAIKRRHVDSVSEIITR